LACWRHLFNIDLRLLNYHWSRRIVIRVGVAIIVGVVVAGTDINAKATATAESPRLSDECKNKRDE
jgi:hypothetical protein